MEITHELDVCSDCAVMIVNGDDSADPERAEKALDHAVGVYGDDLAHISMACGGDDEHEHGTDMFRCDYCGVDTFGEKHLFVIMR